MFKICYIMYIYNYRKSVFVIIKYIANLGTSIIISFFSLEGVG